MEVAVSLGGDLEKSRDYRRGMSVALVQPVSECVFSVAANFGVGS